MTILTAPVLDNFVEVLAPHIQTEDARKIILEEALGADFPLLRKVIWRGSTENFIPQLATLLQEEEAYPGRNALVAIMSTMRHQVSADGLARFDQVRDTLIKQLEPVHRPDFSRPNHLFVSHSSQDNVFVHKITHSLEGVVADVWIDIERLEVGHHWRSEIFAALETSESVLICLAPAAVTSPWVRREISCAMLLGKRLFPLMVEDCYDAMQQYEETKELLEYQFIDFTSFTDPLAYNQAVNALIAQLSDPTKYIKRCPFKGLEAFQEADAAYFFGRQERIDKLIERLKPPSDPRFLAVVGASGSGKSSLVRAGLLPRIRLGKDFDSADWIRVLITPDMNPIRTLAEALHHELASTDVSLVDVFTQLSTEENGLNRLADDILSHAKASPTARLLLVIDQFEKVFTQTDQRDRFLDHLYTAATQPGGRCQIVVTMRADFLHHLSSHPNLARLFEGDNLFFATDMEFHELLETIEGPANKIGLIFEAGLPDRIVRDVLAQPGALPLMQYALKLLYERRDGRHITNDIYQQIGGVKQALATHAEEVFAIRLESAQQVIARRLFLDLITIDPETGHATSRPRELSDLIVQDWTPAAIRSVIDVLASAENRLLITTQRMTTLGQTGTIQQDTWVAISHEALAQHWKTYVGWINENRQALEHRDEYERVAHLWDTNARSHEYLLIGDRLNAARQWLNAPHAQPFITDLQRAFIQAGLEHHAAILEEKRQQERAIERERLENQMRANRRLWQFLSVVTTLLAIAILLAVIAWQLRRQSENRRITALKNESNALSTLALQELTTDPVSSLKHSLAALFFDDGTQRPYIPDAEYALTQAYQTSLERAYLPVDPLLLPDQVALGTDRIAVGGNGVRLVSYALDQTDILLEPDQAQNTHVAWSPDTTALLVYDAQHVHVWRGSTHQISPPFTPISHAVWHPDSSQIAISATGGVWLWSPGETTVSDPIIDLYGTVLGVRWSPTGRHLAAWDFLALRSTLKIWDAETDMVRQIDFTAGIEDAAWSMTGRWLVVASERDVYLIDTEARPDDMEPIILSGHDALVTGINVLSDDAFMTWGVDGTIRIWDWSGNPLAVYQDNEAGAQIAGAVFSDDPDQRYLLAYTSENTLSIFDTTTDDPPLTLRGHLGRIVSVDWSGHYIVTASRDNTARIWDTTTGQELMALYGHTGWLEGAYWTTDQRVLTFSRDGSLRLWDVFDEHGLPLCQGRDSNGELMCRADSQAFRSPDRRGFAIGWQADSTVLVYDDQRSLWHWSPAGGTSQPLTGITNLQSDTAFSADVQYAFTYDPEASGGTLWNVATAQLIITIDTPVAKALWIGNQLLLSMLDGTIALYDPQTGSPIIELANPDGIVVFLAAISPDGQRLIGGDYYSDTLSVWDLATGALLTREFAHDQGHFVLALSPDGRHLAAVSDDGTFSLWDAQTYALEWSYPVADDIGTGAGIAFHPNNTVVAAAVNGIVHVWRVNNRTPLWEITENRYTQLQWNQAGTRLLGWGSGPELPGSTVYSGRAAVWDWATRTKVLEVADVRTITFATFIEHDTQVLTSGESGTVIIWPTGQPLDTRRQHIQSCCISR